MSTASNNDIARAAWDAVKGPDDAPWDDIRNKSHKDKLMAEVEAYDKSGPSSTLERQSPFVQVMTKLKQDQERETAQEIDSLTDKARANLSSAPQPEENVDPNTGREIDLPLPADKPRGVPVSATDAVPTRTDAQGRPSLTAQAEGHTDESKAAESEASKADSTANVAEENATRATADAKAQSKAAAKGEQPKGKTPRN